MKKQIDKKTKITLVCSLVVVVLALAFFFAVNAKSIVKTKGEVSSLTSSSENSVSLKSADTVCDFTNKGDNYITIYGTIIEDDGEDGNATFTFSQGNIVYTKSVPVSSTKQNTFAFTLPKPDGNNYYNLTVSKEGYTTFTRNIISENNVNIYLHNNNMSNLVASGYMYSNIYYNYYQDGLIEIKTIGPVNETANTTYIAHMGSILADVVYQKISDDFGLNYDKVCSDEPDKNGINWCGLSSVIFDVIYSTSIGSNVSISSNNVNVRQYFLLDGRDKIASGECKADSSGDSCILARVLYSVADSTMKGKSETEIKDKVLSVADDIIAIPMNTNVVVKDGVSGLLSYDLMGTVADNITLPIGLSTLGDYVFSSSKIGNLTIPGTVSSFGQGLFSGAEINSITLQNGIDELTNHVFENISKVDTINLPSTLTKIDGNVFSGTKLSSITIPNSVTSIGNYAFYKSGLTSINLPYYLKTIGEYAFANNSLRAIDIPTNVISIGDMSFQENSLENVNISDSVTSIGDSAFNTNNLSSITIPKNVTSIGNTAFRNNPITSVTIEGDKTRFNDIWTNIGFPETLKPSK